MIQKFHEFLTQSFGSNIDAHQVTLIFDTGKNAQENFRGIDTLKLHYVGSIKLGEVKELAEISPQDPRWVSCQTLGLEKATCFRVKKAIYGKERTLIVT